MSNHSIKTLLFAAIAFYAATTFARIDETTNQRFLDIYSGHDILLQKKTAERLTYWGVEDPQIYELINNLILDQYQGAGVQREQTDYLSWLLMGLAASGDEKYHTTFSLVMDGAKSKKIKRYARQAQENLSKYKNWNPIINLPIDPASGLTKFNEQNYFNMVNGDDLELVRIEAKRISNENLRNPVLAKAVANKILELYKGADDQLSRDTVAWLLKALYASGGSEYKEVFDDVASNAYSKKLQRYARQYGNKL